MARRSSRRFAPVRLAGRIAVALALLELGLLMPAAMAAPSDGASGAAWCGEGAPSAAAREALVALEAALDESQRDRGDDPSAPHGGACHSCPAGCAGVALPTFVAVAVDAAFALSDATPSRGTSSRRQSRATGPPLGGRAPPFAISGSRVST